MFDKTDNTGFNVKYMTMSDEACRNLIGSVNKQNGSYCAPHIIHEKTLHGLLWLYGLVLQCEGWSDLYSLMTTSIRSGIWTWPKPSQCPIYVPRWFKRTPKAGQKWDVRRKINHTKLVKINFYINKITYMGHSLKKGPSLLEKQILSYEYLLEKCKIPFSNEYSRGIVALLGTEIQMFEKKTVKKQWFWENRVWK